VGNDPKKYMTLQEFRELGLLHEINRRLLHPLGLALAVGVEKKKAPQHSFHVRIWDCRDDPEGTIFDEEEGLEPDLARKVEAMMTEALERRQKLLGFGVQPID
jgi:hypothetical protein